MFFRIFGKRKRHALLKTQCNSSNLNNESRKKTAENHPKEPVRLNNKKIKVEMNTNGNGNFSGNGSNRKQLKKQLKSVYGE